MRKMKVFLAIGILLGFSLALSCTLNFQSNKERIDFMEKQYNFKNGRFQNLKNVSVQTEGKLIDGLKDYFLGDEIRFPEHPLPIKKVSSKDFLQKKDGKLKITWLGHSSSIIEMDNLLIMTDPVFSKRVSPISFFGPKRFHEEFPLSDSDFEKIDVIIISHDHYDHLDKKAIKKLHQVTERFIVPLGVGKYLEKWGVEKSKISELNWWESTKINQDLDIVATPAQHFSGRSIFDRSKTLWASWVLLGSKERVFFSGDSGYFNGFKEIGDKYGPFDITLMENGQYNEGWADIHMFPEQTVQAHIDLKGKILIPIHWATFNLSIHNWNEPIERLIMEAQEKNVEVATPMAGEKIVYGENFSQNKWWNDIVKKQSNYENFKFSIENN